MTRTLRLQVRDADLNIVTVLDRYESCEIVPKFNPRSIETCGTFEVDGIDVDSLAGDALLQPGAGLVASLDGVRFFSGLVETPERSRTGSATSRMRVFGYSDDVLVASRQAWPVPTTDSLASQTVDADLFNGNASDAIRYYLGRNLVGPTARPSTRVPNLTVPAGASFGANVRGRARFHNLAELVSGLAAAAGGGGIGWRVLHQPAGGLEAAVYQPRNRSAHARFSTRMRNLTSYTYATPKATVTRAVGAGGGEGSARLFAEHSVPAAWHEYRETFIDRRDAGGGAGSTAQEIADATVELQQDATEAVVEGAADASFTATVADTPAVGFLRPDDQGGYGPLDTVTVTVDGESITAMVRSVSVQHTEFGVEVRPTVGGPDASDSALGPYADLLKRLLAAERRVARLERSV